MVKRLLSTLFTLVVILGPTASQAHASDYDGRDRDGGYSYRHHREDDDGYRDRGGYSRHYGDDGGYRGYRDDDGDSYGPDDQDNRCQSGGCDNRSRRCDRSSGDCRSSFSPGPFKDSPVVICAPYSCNSGGEQSGNNGDGRQPPPKQPPRESASTPNPACLLIVPWHCDPKP